MFVFVMVKPFSKVWLHLIGKYWDSKEHSAEGRTEELQLANLRGSKKLGPKSSQLIPEEKHPSLNKEIQERSHKHLKGTRSLSLNFYNYSLKYTNFGNVFFWMEPLFLIS